VWHATSHMAVDGPSLATTPGGMAAPLSRPCPPSSRSTLAPDAVQAGRCNVVVANSSLSLFDVEGMRDHSVGGALWITATKGCQARCESADGSSPLLLPTLRAAFYHGDHEKDGRGDLERMLLGSSQVGSIMGARWEVVMPDAPVVVDPSGPNANALALAHAYLEFQVKITLEDADAFFPWHALCRFADQSGETATVELSKVITRSETYFRVLLRHGRG